MVQETRRHGALERRGQDAAPSTMVCQCCCLPKQRGNRLRLGFNELGYHSEGSMMPPAPRFVRENREFTILVRAGQLRVGVLLSFQRSRETCSINVRGECVGSAITMQWGDNSCVAADRLENIRPQATKSSCRESRERTGRLVSRNKTWSATTAPASAKTADQASSIGFARRRRRPETEQAAR